MPRSLAAPLAAAMTAITLGALPPSAAATPGSAAFSWSFQNTSLTGVPADAQLALTMRNGLAWPLAIAAAPSPNSGYTSGAATLFPAAGAAPNSNWSNVGSNFFPAPSVSSLHAASSPDGRVAFAAADPSGNALGGRVSLPAGGWANLPAATKAVAFDARGNLYTASAFSVTGTAPLTGASAPVIDLAVSRATGDVAVLTSDLRFFDYSAWTNSWSAATLSPVSVSTDAADLEFDSLGRPHVVANLANSLVAYDFDTVTGQWSSPTTLATGINPATHLALAANSADTVGTAFLDSQGRLTYAYKHDTDPWLTSIVATPNSTSPGGQVGIAYDYADLPVLAFAPTFPFQPVTLAYDPIVVPEPSTLTLLTLGALLALTLRRRLA